MITDHTVLGSKMVSLKEIECFYNIFEFMNYEINRIRMSNYNVMYPGIYAFRIEDGILHFLWCDYHTKFNRKYLDSYKKEGYIINEYYVK